MKRIPVKTNGKLKLDPKTVRVLNADNLQKVTGGIIDPGGPHEPPPPPTSKVISCNG